MQKSLTNFLQLMRAPAVFTAFSNILAAHLIVTQGNIQWFSLLLLLSASAALYLAGMVLNDCFDYTEDLLERPNRPLPSGQIALPVAWYFGVILLALGISLAYLVGNLQLYIALLLAGLIVLYNAYAKHTPFGILVMGSCRYVNWLLGLSILSLTYESYLLALPILLYVCSLTLLSTIETTASNRAYLVVTGIGIFLTGVVILLMQFSAEKLPMLAITTLAILLMITAQRLYKIYHDFSPLQIQQTVKFLIMGIIPLDALITLSNSSIWNAGMVLLLLLPGWLLARSMRVT